MLFATETWRAKILAELIAEERCGLGGDRGMLTIYAASVLDLHRLANRILAEGVRLQTAGSNCAVEPQLDLFSDPS